MIAPSVQATRRTFLADQAARAGDQHSGSDQISRRRLWLQQIPGVGPITALYFVLKIEDPARFEKVRDVGAFIGLCPRRDQSGENDPQLRISKRGDAYLRRLLVSAAQYILGPFAPPSALRQYGLIARGRRHRPRQETGRRGRGTQTGRSALNSVEKQKSLSSLPPAAGKNEDNRSGTIAMHRLKRLDFDNQMATFHSSNYDCELLDLNLDRNTTRVRMEARSRSPALHK